MREEPKFPPVYNLREDLRRAAIVILEMEIAQCEREGITDNGGRLRIHRLLMERYQKGELDKYLI